MSNSWNWLIDGSKRMFSNVFGHNTSQAVGLEDPKKPVIPGAPSIDDAQRNIQEVDRVRRRKGVLANIFGGAAASAPSVGTKTLLGQ